MLLALTFALALSLLLPGPALAPLGLAFLSFALALVREGLAPAFAIALDECVLLFPA